MQSAKVGHAEPVEHVRPDGLCLQLIVDKAGPVEVTEAVASIAFIRRLVEQLQ